MLLPPRWRSGGGVDEGVTAAALKGTEMAVRASKESRNGDDGIKEVSA
jgi:hypothetical protein